MSFNPAEIEQAMLVIGLPNSSEEIINNFPRFGVVVRYGKAVDQDSLAAKIVPQAAMVPSKAEKSVSTRIG